MNEKKTNINELNNKKHKQIGTVLETFVPWFLAKVKKKTKIKFKKT